MNEQSNEVFIIDSNTLITPYHFYYSFEFAPKFWDRIEQQIAQKNIILLDKVFDEIASKKDRLCDWLLSIQDLKQIDHKNSEIIENYGKIIRHIQTCGYYKPVALHTWSQEQVADPWIIAAAMTYHYTVITFEMPYQSTNSNQQHNNAKIPNICTNFNVNCKDLFYMMNNLNITL